jgi:4-hydroxy-2-oxoheptanedioate aldolase
MITQIVRNFKTKIKKEPVFGIFTKTTDPAFIEIIGYTGFDFVILDMEHGPNGLENMQNLIRAAQLSNIAPIVRVKENNYSLISEVLDIGAAGVQVPHVRGPQDVKEVLEAARYSPEGMRGVCRFVRAADYSAIEKSSYFKLANEALIILQLEGSDAIKNIDGILELKGFDIIFIGPYDLSQSLGVPGQINHPIVINEIKGIVEKLSSKNILLGIYTDTKEEAKNWMKLGVKYISYNVDVGLFCSLCKNELEELNKIKISLQK